MKEVIKITKKDAKTRARLKVLRKKIGEHYANAPTRYIDATDDEAKHREIVALLNERDKLLGYNK